MNFVVRNTKTGKAGNLIHGAIDMVVYKVEYDARKDFLEPGTLFFSSFVKMRKWVNQEYGTNLESDEITWSVLNIPKTKEALIHWLNIHFQNVNE